MKRRIKNTQQNSRKKKKLGLPVGWDSAWTILGLHCCQASAWRVLPLMPLLPASASVPSPWTYHIHTYTNFRLRGVDWVARPLMSLCLSLFDGPMDWTKATGAQNSHTPSHFHFHTLSHSQVLSSLAFALFCSIFMRSLSLLLRSSLFLHYFLHIFVLVFVFRCCFARFFVFIWPFAMRLSAATVPSPSAQPKALLYTRYMALSVTVWVSVYLYI